jgi:hypothetical protein
MPATNEDYLRRLLKDGHHELLKKIQDGQITVYGAAKKAGYRKGKAATSRSQQIAYHWSRADVAERRRFIAENWADVAPLVSDLIKRQRAKEQAQKPSE